MKQTISMVSPKLNVTRKLYLPDLRPGSVLISLAGTGNIVEDEEGSLLLLSAEGVGLLVTVGRESFSARRGLAAAMLNFRAALATEFFVISCRRVAATEFLLLLMVTELLLFSSLISALKSKNCSSSKEESESCLKMSPSPSSKPVSRSSRSV
uniref:Uncharacterized protein n=1 Tax=Cacopsylla melanoneura TaxID=428564 RepID=A0A8D8XZL7_9HEMI